MAKEFELSLDIAMNNLGWVFFEGGSPTDCGVIQPEIPKELRCLKGDKKLSKRQENVLLIRQLIESLDNVVCLKKPVLVTGEATPGGAKSASAAIKLNVALTAVMSVCLLRGVKYQWVTPNEVKKATAGIGTASKEQIMDWAINRYGGDKLVKPVQITRGKRAGEVDRRLKYYFLGNWICGGDFEHIADACGAYVAAKNPQNGRSGAKGYRNNSKKGKHNG